MITLNLTVYFEYTTKHLVFLNKMFLYECNISFITIIIVNNQVSHKSVSFTVYFAELYIFYDLFYDILYIFYRVILNIFYI